MFNETCPAHKDKTAGNLKSTSTKEMFACRKAGNKAMIANLTAVSL
jgi:hypothetical protein